MVVRKIMMENKELKLISIVESVNAIIWEYEIDKDHWVYVSPQTRAILGFEPEEWLLCMVKRRSCSYHGRWQTN